MPPRLDIHATVVGAGFGEHHCVLLRQAGITVSSLVYFSNHARAAQIAARHGIERISTDIDEALATRPDLVVVVVPVAEHAAMVERALEVASLVVCDKPLARTPDEAVAMARLESLSKASGAMFFQWRFHRAFRRLREMVESGDLGEIAGYSLTFDHDFLDGPGTSWPWRHTVATAGAGALADQGVHLLDMVRWLSGEEPTVEAGNAKIVWPRRQIRDTTILAETDDVAAAHLTLPDGAFATLAVNRCSVGRRRLCVNVIAREGHAEVVVDPDSGASRLVTPRSEPFVLKESEAWINPYDEVANECKFSAEMATFADGVEAQVLLDRILQASTRGDRVDSSTRVRHPENRVAAGEASW